MNTEGGHSADVVASRHVDEEVMSEGKGESGDKGGRGGGIEEGEGGVGEEGGERGKDEGAEGGGGKVKLRLKEKREAKEALKTSKREAKLNDGLYV